MSIGILTLILSVIGALAWLPEIISLLKKQEIFGKIISRYGNYNDKETFFLFKLGLFSKNKTFDLKEVSCEIEFEDGQRFNSVSRNMRKVIFNRNEELQILGKEFINNFAILPSDSNLEGYLFFSFEFVKKTIKMTKTTFLFKSFNNREKKVVFNERDIDERQLFYDDSIWKKVIPLTVGEGQAIP